MRADLPVDAPPWIVVTDLDGTLLDHRTYSWRAAASALDRLRRRGIPVVLNSSKTRIEMQALRREMDNPHPFVTENGAAAYVPVDYFDHLASGRAQGEEMTVRQIFGPRHDELLHTLRGIRRRQGFRFEGFSDWTPQEIQDRTGLALDASTAAAQRDGSEPILWLDARPSEQLAEALASHDLQLQAGGRFLHVMGQTDKGQATDWLLQSYWRVWPDVGVVALGDSANDASMLRRADHAVILPKADGEVLDIGPHRSVLRPSAPGPDGWSQAIHQLLDAAFGDENTNLGDTNHG